ncbi:DUF294 nucleotidyltransferase-like domain-containing protein [Ramlibacter sp. AN1015]|uniref:DUF294 nucleotidyltransferase-like domain-containing protein n=1 Tax=Ramlibacter sp. AN1015 TaxID=3133428 RepID=UPI0030BEE9A3
MPEPAETPLTAAATAAAQGALAPSAPLLAHLRTQLRAWPPFCTMDDEAIDAFLTRARQHYAAPGEVLLAPAQGAARTLLLVRQGTVRHEAPGGGDATALGAGEFMPVAALLAHRPVRGTYTALDDVFVLALDADDVEAVAGRSPPFADYLQARMQALLARSRNELHQTLASQALAQQAMEMPLGSLASVGAVHCAPGTPLREALQTMHARQIGSILVTDDTGALRGIFTRHDLLRVVLAPDFDLDTPIGRVMTSPVYSLGVRDTAQDAALLMGEHAVRHVPVTREGTLVGMVSERDLFALQRTSVQQVSAHIRRAEDDAALRLAAEGIRALARQLLAQGVQARQITELTSRLNDVLTRRVLTLHAARAAIALERLCWLALGSEGRSEQTLASDQDNALVLPDDSDGAERERTRAWAEGVNRTLDACGYDWCRGGIMAGQPACCLTVSDWLTRFRRWIEHGSPHDLLQASIYFDLRPLAGDERLAAQLGHEIATRVRTTPRFLHQLAANALAHRPPLDWAGRIEADAQGCIDLKLQGTALFVDAARILALGQGVQATGTRERLLQSGRALQLQPREYESWVGAFEFLQGLRLRVQLDAAAATGERPNHLRLASLSDIDRRILAASLREARALQQRLALDWTMR